ncbi:hypothetical protein JOQ06_013047 [Pogonophryne albipinna]|uniref:Uncharacterized protein n=1 Tax=Pogonophryne albipinna TaxID=1090488 RepID=A0AAD6BIV9_9TELE|nr:hypothetical protein JOQ06_013047 [Pogonophryne albipinna]
MTPSLTSLNPVKLNLNASGKLQQPPTRGALTRESVMEIENRQREATRLIEMYQELHRAETTTPNNVN